MLLGAIGTFGFSIMSIACIVYIFAPNSPGNKYIEKLPIVVINTTSLVISSSIVFYSSSHHLSELNAIDVDSIDEDKDSYPR